MLHIAIDDSIAPVVLMDHIQSLSVPSTDEGSLSILNVVGEDALHFLKPRFKINHLFGSASYLTEGKFLLSSEVFIQNLEKKLGDKRLDMTLVLLLGLNSLMVHPALISLILLTHFIESPDQVIPLLSELSKLLIKLDFVLSVFDLSVSQVVELLIQISET